MEGFGFSFHYKSNQRAFKSIIAQKLLLYREEICCQTKGKSLLDKCALDIHIKSLLKWSHSIIGFSSYFDRSKNFRKEFCLNKHNILNLIVCLSKFFPHNAYCFRRGLIPKEEFQHTCNMKGGMSFQHNSPIVWW